MGISFQLRAESLALATITMSWRRTYLSVITSRHGPVVETLVLEEHEVAKVGDIPAWAVRAHARSDCLCGVPVLAAQNVWLVEKPFEINNVVNAPIIPVSYLRLLDPDMPIREVLEESEKQPRTPVHLVVDEHPRKHLPALVVPAVTH